MFSKKIYLLLAMFHRSKALRFLIIGGVNTLIAYLIFSGLIFFHVHYSLAVLISTVIGVLVNFKTYGAWVFKQRDNSLIFKFIVVYALQYGLMVGLLKLFRLIGINYYWGGFLSLFFTIPFSFIMNKFWVYQSSR